MSDAKEIKISVKLDYTVKAKVISVTADGNIGLLRTQIAKALEVEPKTHGFTAGLLLFVQLSKICF